jgi:DNA-binding response OmpR family regulator
VASHALLLEDEPLIAMDLEMMLRAEGFDVTTVMSCVEANAWLDRHCPDVVIVDIELRDGACTEVVARLVDANIPFVVHTGAHPSFRVALPFARGAWVGKPAAPGDLIEALRAALDGQERTANFYAKADTLDLLARDLMASHSE